MATGTIPAPAQIGYVDDVTTRSLTFDGRTSFNLSTLSSFPSVPSGAKIMAVSILSWEANNKAFSVVPYSTNQVYLIGDDGLNVVNLKVRLWYAF